MAISSPEMMLVPGRGISTSAIETMDGSFTKVDITKAPAPNLAADTVLVAHTEVLEALKSAWSQRDSTCTISIYS